MAKTRRTIAINFWLPLAAAVRGLSLMATSLVIALGAATYTHAAISYSGTSYFQNFDTLPSSAGAWSNDSTLVGWSLFRQPANAPVAITTIAADTGTNNAGSFYSWGTTSAERALGGLGSGGTYFGSPASGKVAGWIAVALTNNSGATIPQWTVNFDGEQWRNGGNTTAQSMVLQYGFGNGFTDVTTWTTPGGNFDWTSPQATATAGALDGNAAANRVANRGGTVSSAWAPGSTLWIRWIENNDAGNDHGLAIDNFSLSTTGSLPAAIGAISATPANPSIITGGATPFSFTVQNSAAIGSNNLSFSTTASTNVSGTVAGPISVTPQGVSSAISGFSFNGTTVGAGQTGSFIVGDPAAAAPTTKTGTVSVNVYGHASGSVSGSTLTVPDVIVGYAAPQVSNSVNVSNASGYLANLKTTNSGPLNSVSLGNVSAVAPNASSAISATLATGKGVGAYSQPLTLTYADDSTLNGASANVGTTTITVQGNVYDHANPSATNAPIALPDTIAGFNGTISTFNGMVVTNSAGFRSNLKTTGPTSAGYVNIANVNGIAAGNNDTISAGAIVDGSQPVGPGSLNQTFHLTYADDSTLPGAAANLGSVDVAVTGNVYDHASPSASGTSIALQDSIVGYSGTLATNGTAIIGNASGYRVALKTTGNTSGTFSSAGSVTINNVSGVASGGSAGITAAASVNGSQAVGAGALNQAFTLTYADDSSLDGASNNLGTQTVNVSGNVYDHASPSAAGTAIRLPDSIVGYTGSLSSTTSATISNADGYRVKLKTMGDTSSEPFTINNVSGVAPGSSAAVGATAAYDGSQPIGLGVFNRAFTLTYADDSSLNGAASDLGTTTITVSGNVLDHAAPTLSNATPSFGRVMKNSPVPAVTTTLGNDAAVARAGLQITSLSAGVSGVSVNDLVANGETKVLSAAVVTGTAGPYSQSYSIGVSDDQGVIGWSSLANQNFTVYGTVVDNRTVTASPVDFGLVHVGQGGSGSTTLSTSGDNDHFTAVTVPGGASHGVTVAVGTTVFNSDGASEVRAVTSGPLNSAGVLSGSVELATSGEGLSGEDPVKVSVSYNAQVFSGNSVWNSSSGSLWSGNHNWTDANGVQAAPGTFAGFTNTDTATFSGSGSVTSISLSDVNPSLKALSFSNSAYTLSDGTLTLDSSDGTATVTVADNTSEIASTIAGTSLLWKNGDGTLVLSGSNTYSGGTAVDAGTLIVASAAALTDGSSLAVGAGAMSVFAPSTGTNGPTVAASALSAVPEPGTLLLLTAGICGTAVYQGMRLRRKRTSNA